MELIAIKNERLVLSRRLFFCNEMFVSASSIQAPVVIENLQLAQADMSSFA